MKNIKELTENDRLFMIAIGFAIFLSGMSIISKIIPVLFVPWFGGVFIVLGLSIVALFRK